MNTEIPFKNLVGYCNEFIIFIRDKKMALFKLNLIKLSSFIQNEFYLNIMLVNINFLFVLTKNLQGLYR